MAFHLPVSPCAKRLERRPHPPEVAETALGGPARRLRIHPACDVLAGAHLDVEGEFFVYFVSNARPPEHAVKRVQGFTLSAARARSRRQSGSTRPFAPRDAGGPLE